MAGNYSHNARADGTVLTASIYNTDHQNHVNNMTPAGVDDYSANVSQMQTTVDPGESSSESLATDLAGELARLRYIIKEMKNTSQWYFSALNRTVTLGFDISRSDGLKDTPENAWPDAVAVSSVKVIWRVPESYASGDLNFRVYRRGAASGTAVMRTSCSRIRDGEAFTAVFANSNIDFTPGNTATHSQLIAVTAAGFQAADLIILSVERVGTDGSDTMANNVACDGVTVTYTAYAGRP